jgi:hypothetical protein
MKLLQVTIKRADFDKIPEDERTLLILLGHVANELNVLVRLFHWSASVEDTSPIEQKGNNTLVFTVIRIFTGKLHEAWQLLTKAFFSSKLAQSYEQEMSDEDKEHLNELKQYFSKKNLIATVRNGYAFHYAPDQVSSSYSSVPETEELHMYLGETDLNSLYFFADAITNRALLHAIKPDDHQAAMEQLRVETTHIHAAFLHVISALMVIGVKRHLGQTLEELDTIEVEIKPALDSEAVRIPFFVRLEDESDTPLQRKGS